MRAVKRHGNLDALFGNGIRRAVRSLMGHGSIRTIEIQRRKQDDK